MNTILLQRVALVLASSLLATSSIADEFNYDVGLNLSSSRNTTKTTILIPGMTVQSRSEFDSDDIGVGGTWYFGAVEANSGPRSRAAFIERASGLSLRYSHGDGESGSTVPNPLPGNPPDTLRTDESSSRYGGDVRYVWEDSGWYGLAMISRAELDIESPLFSTDFSSNAYGVGGGKYIGSQTAIDLTVTRVEAEGEHSTVAALSLTHIGAMGETWQYGADIGLSDSDADNSDGQFALGFSLYPSRDVAFGVDVFGPLQDVSDGVISYGLFASWYPSERVGLEARYFSSDVDVPSNVDVDQYGYGVGLNMRF